MLDLCCLWGKAASAYVRHTHRRCMYCVRQSPAPRSAPSWLRASRRPDTVGMAMPYTGSSGT